MSDHVAICPDDLHRVATRFHDVVVDIQKRVAVVNTATAGVRLNRRDPGFGIAAFEAGRALVEHHLHQASSGLGDAAEVMFRTVDQAIEGDTLRTTELIDGLTVQIGDWSKTGGGLSQLDRMITRRSELLAELGGGSTAATRVLGRQLAAGRELGPLFHAARCGDLRVQFEIGRLFDAGAFDDAESLDAGLAVARLVFSDVGEVKEVDRGIPALEQFDQLVGRGVDVGVAANTITGGYLLPSRGELTTLTDLVTSGIAPWGDRRAFTPEQWAWLPFAVRMSLQSPTAVVEARTTELRSMSVPLQLIGGHNEVATRALVIGEFGRAGLDHTEGGSVLAAGLADLVFTIGPDDLGSHQQVANVLSDPRIGLDTAFFDHLGAGGLATLTQHVMQAADPSASGGQGYGYPARLEAIAFYGQAMAAVERRGELGYTVDEMLDAGDGLVHSPAYLLGGETAFSQEFALSAAVRLLDQARSIGSHGIADPRAMAIHQVNLNGTDTGRRLFEVLGDGYLDTLLWNHEPIESNHEVHPVYQLFQPIIDEDAINGSGADSLTTAVVAGAGERRRGDVAHPAAQVIEHAIISDIRLLAPMTATEYGRRQRVKPLQAVNAVETVFRSGSGDRLLAYTAYVAPIIIHGAVIEGRHSITDETMSTHGEAVEVVLLGREEAKLAEAADRDEVARRVTFWGPTVVTAIAGGMFQGPTEALITKGMIANAGTGLATNSAISTNNRVNTLEHLRLTQHQWGANLDNQLLTTLQQHGAINYAGTPEHMPDIYNQPIHLTDRTPAGTYKDWLDWIDELQRVRSEIGDDYGRKIGLRSHSE